MAVSGCVSAKVIARDSVSQAAESLYRPTGIPFVGLLVDRGRLNQQEKSMSFSRDKCRRAAPLILASEGVLPYRLPRIPLARARSLHRNNQTARLARRSLLARQCGRRRPPSDTNVPPAKVPRIGLSVTKLSRLVSRSTTTKPARRSVLHRFVIDCELLHIVAAAEQHVRTAGYQLLNN